jgi:hypothetical protein
MLAVDRDLSPSLEILRDVQRRGCESFADLIAPLTKARFMEGCWQKRPYHVKRNLEGYFDDLISLDQIDSLLSSTSFYDGEIRVARDGVVVPAKDISIAGVVDRNKVWSLYADGATVVFEHLNRKHPGLLKLSARCEEEFKIPFRANAYLTPPQSKGFDLHYDTHDVLILQVAGSKTWQIHDNPLPLPHEEQTFRPVFAQRSRLLSEIVMEPGDVLYLPRGYIHGASANERISFHVTIGIRSVSLREMCETALRRLLLSDRRFREVCLFDRIHETSTAARQALLGAIDHIDILPVLRDAELSFLRKRSRPFDGRFIELLSDSEVVHDTRMRLSRGAIISTVENDGRLFLFFDRKNVALPVGVAPALETIRSRREFRVGDLPGLESESKTILARTLYKARLLDVVGRDRRD